MDDKYTHSKNAKERFAESDSSKRTRESAMAGERLCQEAYSGADCPGGHSESESKSLSQRLADSMYSFGQAIKHVFVSDAEPAKGSAVNEKPSAALLSGANASSKLSLIDSLQTGNIEGLGNCDVPASLAKSDAWKDSRADGKASSAIKATEPAKVSLLDSLKAEHIEGVGTCEIPARNDGLNKTNNLDNSEKAKPALLDLLKAGNIEGVGNCDVPSTGLPHFQAAPAAKDSATTDSTASSAAFKRDVLESAGEQSARVLDRATVTPAVSQPNQTMKVSTIYDALKSDNLKGVGDCEVKNGNLPTLGAPKVEELKPAANQAPVAADLPQMKVDAGQASSKGDSNYSKDYSAVRRADVSSVAGIDAGLRNQVDPGTSTGLLKGIDSTAPRGVGLDKGYSDPRSSSEAGRISFEAKSGFDARVNSDSRAAGESRSSSAATGAYVPSTRDFLRNASIDSRVSADSTSKSFLDSNNWRTETSLRKIDEDSRARVSIETSAMNEQRKVAESDARIRAMAGTADGDRAQAKMILNSPQQNSQQESRASADSLSLKNSRDDTQSNASALNVEKNNSLNRLSDERMAYTLQAARAGAVAGVEASAQAAFAVSPLRIQLSERASLIVSSGSSIDKAASPVSDRAIASDRASASSSSMVGSFFDSGKVMRAEDGALSGRRDASSALSASNSLLADKHFAENSSVVKSGLMADSAGRMADLKGAQKTEAGGRPLDKNAESLEEGIRPGGRPLPGTKAIVVNALGLDEGISINRGEFILTDGTALLNQLNARRITGSSDKLYLTGVEITIAAILALSGAAKVQDERAQLIEAIENADASNADPVPAQILHRRTHMVSPGQTLLTIAEDLYQNSAVAWLIADLNRANIKDELIEGKRVVELKSRQVLELPESQEVAAFMARLSKDFEASRLITIVSDSTVDRELLESFLGTVSGAPIASAPAVAGPVQIKLEHKLPEFSIAMEEDGQLDEPALTNIVKDLSVRVGRLLKRPHGKLSATT